MTVPLIILLWTHSPMLLYLPCRLLRTVPLSLPLMTNSAQPDCAWGRTWHSPSAICLWKFLAPKTYCTSDPKKKWTKILTLRVRI